MSLANIGHKDDPAFQGQEALWAYLRAACHEEFQRIARYLLNLSTERREAELSRYGRTRDRIAEVELGNFVDWTLAGKPRQWTPTRRV